MYVPKYFKAKELIPTKLYKKYKSRGDAWMLGILFDERLLKVADSIRDSFGPMTVNDWAYGGKNQWRGFRGPSCGIGATLSQHRFGRALDLIPKNISPDEIRDELIEKQNDPIYNLIGGLEMNITWLHIDVRQRNADNAINLFYP